MVGALYHKLQTQSSAPEDGRNYRPKHVELIEIVNKIITVAAIWLFILLYHDARSHKRETSKLPWQSEKLTDINKCTIL